MDGGTRIKDEGRTSTDEVVVETVQLFSSPFPWMIPINRIPRERAAPYGETALE